MLLKVHRHVTSRQACVAFVVPGCKRLISSSTRVRSSFSQLRSSTQWPLETIAIETSCDDTAVAVLSITAFRKDDKGKREGVELLQSRVLFNKRITADSSGFGGIHPLVALRSHRQNLASLIKEALEAVNESSGSVSNRYGGGTWHPAFVSVTRGPGMRSNLSVGVDTAKGLAVAWDVPLVGVHHMLAHAITPRLIDTLRSRTDTNQVNLNYEDGQAQKWSWRSLSPAYPFLGVLVSGGHTLLIDSKSLFNHKILAETTDVAIGDCLDKVARDILPSELLVAPYGRALEQFAFPEGERSYRDVYRPPLGRGEEMERRPTEWSWSLNPPLSESSGPDKSSRRMIYSFAGICMQAQRVVQAKPEASIDERRKLASETLRVAFEHLASRILLHLTSLSDEERAVITTIVVSGGVASNQFLRHILRSTLDARGFPEIRLEFPPIELCTDNALMIAWAGVELFVAGYTSDLGIEPIRKWSLDPSAEDGGVLGVGGWKHPSKEGQPI